MKNPAAAAAAAVISARRPLVLRQIRSTRLVVDASSTRRRRRRRRRRVRTWPTSASATPSASGGWKERGADTTSHNTCIIFTVRKTLFSISPSTIGAVKKHPPKAVAKKVRHSIHFLNGIQSPSVPSTKALRNPSGKKKYGTRSISLTASNRRPSRQETWPTTKQ